MGFLAAIPYKTEGANNKKTIKKLNKELGFNLVERLMQVSMRFFSHTSYNEICLKNVGTQISIFFSPPMNGFKP